MYFFTFQYVHSFYILKYLNFYIIKILDEVSNKCTYLIINEKYLSYSY